MAEFDKMYFTQNLIFDNLEGNQDSKLPQNFYLTTNYPSTYSSFPVLEQWGIFVESE